MKNLFKYSFVVLTLIIFNACVAEQMIVPDPNFELSFQRNGKTDALVGVPFYAVLTGQAEFLTLYDGTAGHVWGEAGAKGVDFNNADSLLVQYSTAGKYNLTIVASSSANQASNFERQTKTIEINVLDERNNITNFSVIVQGVTLAGTITANNEIQFSLPDIITNFNFIPTFSLASSLAKVYVNNVEQTSAVSSIDFSLPVVYTVKPSHGAEKQYTVKFSTFASSSEKKLTKFILGTTGGNSEVGVIDEANKTITVAANYGTSLNAVTLVLESSYLSKVTINDVAYADRTKYNLLSTGTRPVKTIKVIAQNNSESIYNLAVTALDPVTEFSFLGLTPAPIGIIDNVAKTITINVLKGTDISKLVAKWKGTVGAVKIGTTSQTNGLTVNDFSSPMTYTFYKGTTVGASYVITVVEK